MCLFRGERWLSGRLTVRPTGTTALKLALFELPLGSDLWKKLSVVDTTGKVRTRQLRAQAHLGKITLFNMPWNRG